MTTTLWDTTGGEIGKALAAERRASSAVTSGLALTLVVTVDEKNAAEAEKAATVAAQSHPCRLILVIRRQLDTSDRLDAEVQVGGRLGPVEAVVMRMYGRLSLHAESVVLPLLAPDCPVVTWWHGPPPDEVATDPLGVLADRRVTDCALAPDPLVALAQRARDFAPGDTDLAWTRTTPWRSLLASAFDAVDVSVDRPVSARTAGEAANPSARLLAAWIGQRLGIESVNEDSRGPGITETQVVLSDRGGSASRPPSGVASDGDAEGPQSITITRHDGRLATFSRTGQPERKLPLVRRPLGDLLAEELRRTDHDEVYAEALGAATGADGLSGRAARRTHRWHDPAQQAAATS